MPNPYMDRGADPADRAEGLEARQLAHLTGRLEALGAKPDTIAAVVERWPVEDDEDRADRAAVIAAGDADLLAAIREVEEEHDANTTEPGEVEGLRADADEWVKGTVAEVVEQVAGDRDRAAAALAAEEAQSKPRVTLVEELQAILEPAEDDDGAGG